MQHSVIDRVGIRVSRLGFGTASLHRLFSAKARQALLRAATDAGITHFDTAPYYGYGLAEMDLGRIVCGHRSDITITTKVGLYPLGPASSHAFSVWSRKLFGRLLPAFSLPVVNWQVNRARSSLRESLKRLNTNYVDFLFLHEPDRAAVDTEEMMNWLESERKLGTIRAWGLAGTSGRVVPWVQASHPLAAVIQTRDSLDLRQADFVLHAGRSLQFTYGYLSGPSIAGDRARAGAIIRDALDRNHTGSILVSTHNLEHIDELAKMVV